MATAVMRFGTREWADENVNFIDGCIHDCKYCYSKEMAIRFGRSAANSWKNETVRKKDLRKTYKKTNGIIMFPSAHDISPDHLDECLIILERILLANNRVLIVTKPHLECIQKLCSQMERYRSQILFRFTIGSCSSSILKFWEPGAPSFEERFESLKYAYKMKYATSISCEPMLDDNICELVKAIYPYVTDTIWIGKANFLLRRLKMNGQDTPETVKKALELISLQSDKNIDNIVSKLRDLNKIRWKESILKVINNREKACILSL